MPGSDSEGSDTKLNLTLEALGIANDECYFYPGHKVRKIGGSYQATGTIVARFQTTTGLLRYVFEFDKPPGLLHVFQGSQLERIEDEEIPVVKSGNEAKPKGVPGRGVERRNARSDGGKV